MPPPLQNIFLIGMHPVRPTPEEFDAAVEIQWGAGLSGGGRARAIQSVREHYHGLFLMEIQIEPPDAEFDWGRITQVMDGQPRSNWQVPYDERPVDPDAGRWAFFLHYVVPERPLSTPVGDRQIPNPSATPGHLASIKYDLP